jgi:hypothetical protein
LGTVQNVRLYEGVSRTTRWAAEKGKEQSWEFFLDLWKALAACRLWSGSSFDEEVSLRGSGMLMYLIDQDPAGAT